MLRTGLALALVTLAAACGDFSAGSCVDDPGGRHHAVNPATGECWEFASSCDVPAEWDSCGGEPECDETRTCPPDRVCTGGVCVPVGAGCTSDADCPDTQHCEFASPSPEPTPPDIAESGICVDNNSCTDDSQCPLDQWCDWGTPDCDPNLPDCGIAAGTCSRGPRPGECRTWADCPADHHCLAEWGGAPVCQPVCYGDAQCTGGEYCTIADGVCLPPPGSADTVCTGWCANRPGQCDNAYEDCAIEEVCTSDWTGMPPGTCEPACYDSSTCQPGTHCNNMDGVCVTPHWKRDTGGGRKEGAPAGEADSDALIPICAGWCVP